jgi:ABC-type amino acid transport substrate-binding protein
MRIFLFGLLTALFAFSAYAKEDKVYTIGVERIHYLPYYTYEGAEYSGYARDLFDMFAEHAGVSFEYKILPVERLFDNFLNKKDRLDFKFPDNPMWRQDLKKGKKVTYSKSIAPYIDGVMVRPKNIGKGKKALKVLGTARGFTPWDYLGDLKKGKMRKQENNSFTGLIKQAIAGRVDGAYINIAVATYQLKHVLHKTGSLIFDNSLPHTNSHYLLSSIQHPEMIKKFDQFLKEKASDIAVLKQKYGINSISGQLSH